MPVEAKNQRARELEPAWDTVGDVTAGPRAVRAKTTRYVPKLPSHAKHAGLYQDYLGRAVFNPVAQRALRAFVGMVCGEEPKVDVPDAAVLADVTQTGVSYHDFARDVFRQALAPGRVGILVDMPAEPAGSTPRAFQRIYAANAILDWREETVGQLRKRGLRGVDSQAVNDLGVSDATPLTTHLRLLDRIAVPDRQDEWNSFPASQIRVIDLTDVEAPDGPTLGLRIRLYRQPLDERGRPTRGKFVLAETLAPPTRRGAPIPLITFVPINTMGVGLEPEEPALLGLCELNLSQFRSSADLENGRWKLGHPQLNVFGATGGTYEVGGGVWEFDSPQSRVEVLQVQDQFGALERAITEKAEQMVAECARLMSATDATTAETATAAKLKAAGERSLLIMAALVSGEGLQRALAYQVWMEDGVKTLPEVQKAVSVKLREEFDDVQLSAQDMEAIVGAHEGGAITDEDLHWNLDRGKRIKPGQEFAAWNARRKRQMEPQETGDGDALDPGGDRGDA